MAARPTGTRLQNQLNILSTLGVVGDCTDGQLLQRFVSAHEDGTQAAFTALVERHGPMVLGVCRAVLGDSHDVDDAFQATFLVLLRRAGSVRNADSVASWLHGVAFRVARRAKLAASQRRVYERKGAEMRALKNQCGAIRPEDWSELHEEIARLPLRYREPLVLCYLEGLTTEAAAQRLRCPKGTILSRLSRGRDQLRARLTGRGLAPATGLVPENWDATAARTRVPAPLLCATVKLTSRILEQTATSGLVSGSVASLAAGALRAMFWTKLTAGGAVGLAVAALVFSTEAAIAYQATEKAGRGASSQTAAQERATPLVRPADAAGPSGYSAAIIVPLPARAELHELLRRAAKEAVAVTKSPVAKASTLRSIAIAQAKGGDLDGARASFETAASEIGSLRVGQTGAAGSPWNLWRIGHAQAECGMRDESRVTLRRAVTALPGVSGNFTDNLQALDNFARIAAEQATVGARQDARKTVESLLEFAKKFFAATTISNARDASAPKIAAALAVTGDFEGAFAWSEGVENAGDVLGEIAVAASKCLHPIAARRFVREAAERLGKLELADETYSGLADLAEAQARLGDVVGAKKSARAIGEGRLRVRYDMTEGQPSALVSIARVQHQAGDIAGAVVTLREAFRLIRDHKSMRGRDGRYAQVIGAQITNGDIDGAIQSTGEMEETRANVLAEVARAQAASGDLAAARRTFARALRDAGLAVEDPAPPDLAFANLPGVDPKMSLAARTLVAEIEAMAGNVDAALKTVRSDDEKGYRQFAFQRVVSARAIAGDVTGALRICLDECKTPQERLSALEGFGQGVETRLSLKVLEPRARAR